MHVDGLTQAKGYRILFFFQSRLMHSIHTVMIWPVSKPLHLPVIWSKMKGIEHSVEGLVQSDPKGSQCQTNQILFQVILTNSAHILNQPLYAVLKRISTISKLLLGIPRDILCCQGLHARKQLLWDVTSFHWAIIRPACIYLSCTGCNGATMYIIKL